jgi:hypothetical protein
MYENASKLEIWAAMKAAHDMGLLPIFTVYDRPSDYPDGFIARMSITGAVEMPTLIASIGSLEEIRETLMELGLTRMDRHEADDAKIVENWL